MIIPRFAIPGALITLALAVSPGLSAAQALGDAGRGKVLYETRCVACHEISVHNRNARKAATFTGLRAQVERWSEQVGGSWSAGEVDDVTLYLNQRFYRFPCPQTLCKADQASIVR